MWKILLVGIFVKSIFWQIENEIVKIQDTRFSKKCDLVTYRQTDS